MKTENKKVTVTKKVAHLYSVDFHYFLASVSMNGVSAFVRYVLNCEKMKEEKNHLYNGEYNQLKKEDYKNHPHYLVTGAFSWVHTEEGESAWKEISDAWRSYLETIEHDYDRVVWHWDDGTITVLS